MSEAASAKKGYYWWKRNDIVALVPETCQRILDVGCAVGMVGKALKCNRADRYIVGIEVNPEVAQHARARLDEVLVGDVEELDLDRYVGYFDCIIYADILEHLRDPWGLLKAQRRLLVEDGYVVASIPNVQYYYILLHLVRGRWPYADRGVLDRTHLRFFTLREIKALFVNTGFEIHYIERVYRLLDRRSAINRHAREILRWLFPLRGFFTFQYLVLAAKAPAKR
jgi:2-polyprenyl-3-methyl-5-hydroxy-6-metoxy-1,4-benzoquinol methylase